MKQKIVSRILAGVAVVALLGVLGPAQAVSKLPVVIQAAEKVDNLVQKEELRGPMSRMKTRFEALDVDQNGGLDKKELEGGGVNRTNSRAEQETPDL